MKKISAVLLMGLPGAIITGVLFLIGFISWWVALEELLMKSEIVNVLFAIWIFFVFGISIFVTALKEERIGNIVMSVLLSIPFAIIVGGLFSYGVIGILASSFLKSMPVVSGSIFAVFMFGVLVILGFLVAFNFIFSFFLWNLHKEESGKNETLQPAESYPGKIEITK